MPHDFQADGLSWKNAALRARGVGRLRISAKDGDGISELFHQDRAWIAKVGGVPLTGVRFFDLEILCFRPQVTFPDPRATLSDPWLLFHYPWVTVPALQVVFSDPRGTFHDLLSTFSDLQVMVSDPLSIFSDPQVTFPDPRVTFSDPWLLFHYPWVTVPALQVVFSDPRGTFHDLLSTFSDLQGMVSDPLSIFSDPQVTFPDPRVTFSDPLSTFSDLGVMVSDLRVAFSDLQVAFSDPRGRVLTQCGWWRVASGQVERVGPLHLPIGSAVPRRAGGPRAITGVQTAAAADAVGARISRNLSCHSYQLPLLQVPQRLPRQHHLLGLLLHWISP